MDKLWVTKDDTGKDSYGSIWLWGGNESDRPVLREDGTWMGGGFAESLMHEAEEAFAMKPGECQEFGRVADAR